VQTFLIKSIHVYRRLLSPVIGQQCRFTPTCSQYAEQAIELYGPARGSWMAAKRILRCQPLCEGGHDPVPGNEDHSRIGDYASDEQPR
jgi:putative membrane protein insertion efficiency factor